MSARGWTLFATSSLIWGVPYLFIKIAVDAGVPPAFVAWARIGLARHIWPIAAYAATEIAIPFVHITVGERGISSSLAAILVATMPLQLALLALRIAPGERLTPSRLLGLLIGLGGVVALLGVDVGRRQGELLGAVLVLLATLCYATAPLIVNRWLVDLDPLGPVAASLVLSSIALLPAAIIPMPRTLPTPAALGAIAVLGVVCTALGLIVFFQLIAEAGPSRASIITYLNPLVAVIVGVLALHEHVGPTSLAGLLLILAGSWLSTRSPRSSPAH